MPSWTVDAPTSLDFDHVAGGACLVSAALSARSLRKKSSEGLVKRILSSVVFRNMSSEELRRQAEPGPLPGSRHLGRAADEAAVGLSLGYDPDDPETWPGNRPTGDVSAETRSGSGERLDLTDPKAMRALAHPVRLALMEILDVTRTLTATQASEMLGESPANCAFHLRTLAKYGLVREAGGGRGRERPWTAAQRSITLSSHNQEDKQAELAARTLGEVWNDRMLDRIRHALVRDSWPDGWADAVWVSRNVRFLTSEEASQVAEEIHEILQRYKDRLDDPSLRPAGALPVEITFFEFPLTELSADM
jgi:predicted transcriptional regulator